MPTYSSVSSMPAALSSSSAQFDFLQPSPRMPVLFIGHGSPMNAIEDNRYRRSWEALGSAFGDSMPVPQLILCISAHWITRGWWLTGMAKPKTIHDFGGFPQALFDQQYPAPGAPGVAEVLAAQLTSPDTRGRLGVDASEWGFDHGTWSILQPMFPAAKIPVLQLSMDYNRPPIEHFQLGQQLRALRDRGVLIVGSGNIVHNLRAIMRHAGDNQTYEWSQEFDQTIAGQIRQGQLEDLADFQSLGQVARMAHPTYDHYLPLLYAAGAVDAGETPRFFNEAFQAGSISMRSVVWG